MISSSLVLAVGVAFVLAARAASLAYALVHAVRVDASVRFCGHVTFETTSAGFMRGRRAGR